ncbi:MAG TPA: sec-independent translocase [Marmoricola sp.]|jgi:sec-independent protein translocase protein TatB|nr:sec-independent translocase [Marmoricola sp.]
MFGVGLPEVAVILVVAMVVFGPDKLPDYARQAGRMVRQLRRFAQDAQNDLRNELGPEFADLKLTDLDPRVAIRKHILDAIEEEDLAEAQAVLKSPATGGPELGAGERPPFDVEAT